MNGGQDPITPFRGRLLGLAYRMLGCRAEANDVLQDAFLRLHGSTNIINLEAWLVTVVTRLCLDRLKSARTRREAYTGPWLPEPVLDAEALSAYTKLELADDISFALMLVLERLSPPERTAFLLHDVFDLGFAEIADVLGRSEMACRQLASRARKWVRDRRSVRHSSSAPHRLLTAFGEAVASGDVSVLTALLCDDAVLLSDGGGIRAAALNPICGANQIARYLVGTARKFGEREPALLHRACMINGAPGVVSYLGEQPEQALSILADDNRIAEIYVVRNPQKLAHLSGGTAFRPELSQT
jgi:RNA polymerase sigma-70 factor (ECF subfamily)